MENGPSAHEEVRTSLPQASQASLGSEVEITVPRSQPGAGASRDRAGGKGGAEPWSLSNGPTLSYGG